MNDAESERVGPAKDADAFRTISEVAEDLRLPQHVLRFWETRFPQIRPLKRGGGRRYYRPADVVLLRGIQRLLYEDGYTIKGVQRLFKDKSAKALFRDDLADASASAAPIEDDERDVELTPPLPDHAGSVPSSAAADLLVLKQALATLEDCERILAAVRRPAG